MERERMTLQVGLIGAGRIGRLHAHNIAAEPRCRLAAVADPLPEAAERLAGACGAAVRTPAEILDDEAIGAILIASPTDTHAELIEAGVRAGKAVFCEKPVDLALTRARACLRAVAETEGAQPVMIGFNRRFDPHFAALKAAFDAGEIGRGTLLSIVSFDPAPPPPAYVRSSGGLFRDMSIHDFDIACWIFGALPESVSATGSCLVDPAIGAEGDIDTAVITLRLADGRIATIRNSRRASYGYDQRLELLGEGGLLAVENVPENMLRKAGTQGVVGARPEHFFLERYHRSYAIAWERFVDSVLQDTPVPVSLADGVNALAIAEAAACALETGRAEALP